MPTVDIEPRHRNQLGSPEATTSGFQVRWRSEDGADWIAPDQLWCAERSLAEALAKRVAEVLEDPNVDGRDQHDVLCALWP